METGRFDCDPDCDAEIRADRFDCDPNCDAEARALLDTLLRRADEEENSPMETEGMEMSLLRSRMKIFTRCSNSCCKSSSTARRSSISSALSSAAMRRRRRSRFVAWRRISSALALRVLACVSENRRTYSCENRRTAGDWRVSNSEVCWP